MIAGNSSNLHCPVKLMDTYLAANPTAQPHWPLFQRNDSQLFTRAYLIKIVTLLSRAPGLEGHFMGHSFQHGAATWAALQGISEEDISALGRWKSAAVKRYIVKPSHERHQLAERFARPSPP